MNKKLLLGMFALFFVLLSIQSVYAIDILDSVLQPFKGTDVGKIYETYSLFIDSILYLLLFLGLAQLIYVKIYGKKEGKLVAIAVGLALTFAMALLESRTGFRLSELMPIGAIILIFVLFILLYNLFDAMFKDAGASFSLAFLIMYGFLMSTFSPLYKWLEAHAPLLAALVQIAMIVSFVVLIIKLIKLIPKKDKSDSDDSPTIGTVNEDEKTTSKPPKGPPGPNVIQVTSPDEGQQFNPGDMIKVAFNVGGPGFNDYYDYELLLNGRRFGRRTVNRPDDAIITKVRGSQVFPIMITAGTQTRPGANVIQINAIKRRKVLINNEIFAQSAARNFTVSGGSGGAPEELVSLITKLLKNQISQLYEDYNKYVVVFSTLVGIHHEFATGRSTQDVPQEVWDNLIVARVKMLKTASNVNGVLTAIHEHKGYEFLGTDHLTVLAENIELNAKLRRVIIEYEIQVRKEYIDKKAPIAPKRPW